MVYVNHGIFIILVLLRLYNENYAIGKHDKFVTLFYQHEWFVIIKIIKNAYNALT